MQQSVDVVVGRRQQDGGEGVGRQVMAMEKVKMFQVVSWCGRGKVTRRGALQWSADPAIVHHWAPVVTSR